MDPGNPRARVRGYGAGDPVDRIGGLVAVRGGGLGADAMPAWILDGSPAP